MHTEVFKLEMTRYLGLASKFSRHEPIMQMWQNLDNFSLGDGHVEAYYTILSTLKCVWKKTFLNQ